MLDGVDVDPFPHLERWLDAVGQRPATLKAYERAKSYNKNAMQPPSPRKSAQDFGAARAAPQRRSGVIFQNARYRILARLIVWPRLSSTLMLCCRTYCVTAAMRSVLVERALSQGRAVFG